MTLNLKASQLKLLPFDFKEEVEKFIKAKKNHQKTTGEAAPAAPHVWVECAVRTVQYPIEAVHQPANEKGEPVGDPIKFMSSEEPDDYVADYEIEDDTPPPPTLDEHKKQLAADAVQAADAALALVFPPLRRRLMQLTFGAARSVEPAKRTAEQNAAVAHADAIDKMHSDIQWQLARTEAEIHELTAETIDGWKPPVFKAE